VWSYWTLAYGLCFDTICQLTYMIITYANARISILNLTAGCKDIGSVAHES